MSVSAISFLNTLSVLKAGQTQPIAQIKKGNLQNTFAGKTNLNAPSHADICDAQKYLGDAVPGSTLCITA